MELTVWGSTVSSHSAVWGEASPDKGFGAYLSQKEQLWLQYIFTDFPENKYNFY